MKCPHCGVEHDPASGRFCEQCGRSVIAFTKPDENQGDGAEGEEPVKVRCRFCGMKSTPPVCLACGTPFPVPD